MKSINYSDREVVLSVVDPLNPSNHGGGDVLNPYGMGGAICCFGIPEKWHLGYQVIVQYSFYPDKTWHEKIVDVPPYAEGIAGDIWIAMHEDGQVEAVVSNFGPARSEWPGRIKGPPVASEKYIQKIRADRINMQKRMLVAMENAYKNDISRATPEQVEKLKQAIEDTRNRIQLMEGSNP